MATTRKSGLNFETDPETMDSTVDSDTTSEQSKAEQEANKGVEVGDDGARTFVVVPWPGY